jgi:hypothetical protein
MLIQWEQDSQKLLDDFSIILEQARKSLDRLKHAGRDLKELEASYEQAKHIFETVEAGDAVHNIEYANTVLDTAKKKLQPLIAQTKP